MLGVHRLAAAGIDYYLDDLARELPVPATGPDRPAWCGRAAAGLGLVGPVEPGRWRAVLDGRHPDAGHNLRSGRAGVAGYDLTFSAPKSVSVLFGLGTDDVARQVLAAHRGGVEGAMAYLEHHGLSARRRSGEASDVVPTTGMVSASFTHGVNRNLDPHLHSHVVLANLVHGVDGRWSACDQRGLHAHRTAAGAVYDAHLRAGLSDALGVRWVQSARLGIEVQGVSPLLIGEFSSRAADIRRHRAERGWHSARGDQVAWAATRPPKVGGRSFADLRREWASRASFVDGPGPDLAAGRARPGGPGRSGTVDEHRFRAALSRAPDGAARRRDVVAAFGASAVGGARAATIGQVTDLWCPSGGAVGVAEAVRPLRPLVPGDHLLRALGPRPLDGRDHAVWRDGARAIEDYRRRWGVRPGTDALGLAPGCSVSSLPAPRLADHLRTDRTVEAARQRLAWREPPGREMGRGR